MMFDLESTNNNESLDRALEWLKDARNSLDSIGPEGISDEDERFLQRTEAGLELSEDQILALASLQIRREYFFKEHGVDPLLEQFFGFKSGTRPWNRSKS